MRSSLSAKRKRSIAAFPGGREEPRLAAIRIAGKIRKFPGPGGWHFVAMSKTESGRLRRLREATRVAWGYVVVRATLGKTSWDTTLFPAKGGAYFIALRADVRKREKVGVGDRVTVDCVVR